MRVWPALFLSAERDPLSRQPARPLYLANSSAFGFHFFTGVCTPLAEGWTASGVRPHHTDFVFW